MKVAVIGVGAMGRNHARVYQELDTAELVAVSDPNDVAARRVADLHGARSYVSHVELLARERPDAVTVAVPTSSHYDVVRDALDAGCHVLVEKPIAATIEEAEHLVARATAAGRVLMVGHIERFNPAVMELGRQLRDGELGRIFQVHARRLGPFPPRVRDVGVVTDLATHDLDIMRYLTSSEVVRVYAATKREVHTTREDLLNGILHFRNGAVGLLEINWLTPTKIRELYVTGERGMFRADYLTQDLYFYANAESGVENWGAMSVLRGVSEGTMTRFAVQKVEPLRAELEAFLRSANGEDGRIVSGRDGVAALRLALALIESGETGKVVECGPNLD